MVRRAYALLALLLTGPCAIAQQNNGQLWVDGIIGRNFASEFMFETEFSYQRLLSGGADGWYSLNATPSVERSMTPHWDLLVGFPLSYTIQNDTSRSSEMRLQFGSRFLFTPFKRVQTRLLIRWEERYVRDEETMEVDNTNRLRLRAEIAVPLDAPRWNADTMWYALTDVEVFFTSSDVQERFANRMRNRIGIGRKFSYNWRLEFLYTLQRSRNALDDSEPSNDHIFRLRLKYYMTPRVRKRHDAGGSGT